MITTECLREVYNMVLIELVRKTDNGWEDFGVGIRLWFRNYRRFLYFVEYYSSKHDVLIRCIMNGRWWFATYVGGKCIWTD